MSHCNDDATWQGHGKQSGTQWQTLWKMWNGDQCLTIHDSLGVRTVQVANVVLAAFPGHSVMNSQLLLELKQKDCEDFVMRFDTNDMSKNMQTQECQGLQWTCGEKGMSP